MGMYGSACVFTRFIMALGGWALEGRMGQNGRVWLSAYSRGVVFR